MDRSFGTDHGEHRRSCLLEIKAATGGNEASLFVEDMLRMYAKFAEKRNCKLEIVNLSPNQCGGFREIISRITGGDPYRLFGFESGGHRVQRVPETESQGRIHTSTCVVAVMPEVTTRSLPEIREKDLRIDSFRSSGAGGQHVNTTDSAVRITHIPTGITVSCQDERSQHKNKNKALSILRSRLRKLAADNLNKEESDMRRNLLGSGERSDRIRTYNFPGGRVTDHRIGKRYRLGDIMSGRLHQVVEDLIRHHSSVQNLLPDRRDNL